ncbi:MAG: quinoprotein dehydrogenase-associated putative ABC transporter substrate-binding protein [Rhizobacter sp.]
MRTPWGINRVHWPSRLAIAVAMSALACAAVAAEPHRVLAVCADPSNLPFSNDRGEGFENRIASLLADELHATVNYTWNMQRRSFLRRTLKAGACDVVIGLPTGLQGVAQTRPYYGSSYAFVTPRQGGAQVSGFDDPGLRKLKIGLQAVGAEGSNTPPASALARRGLSDHVVGFSMWGEESDETPQAHIVDAVAYGEIDMAIVWGPVAGYFAQRHGDQLTVTPVTGDPLQPTATFQFEMAVSVRPGDNELLKELQQALDRRQPDIQAILQTYGVPLLANTAPSAPLAKVETGPVPGSTAETRRN